MNFETKVSANEASSGKEVLVPLSNENQNHRECFVISDARILKIEIPEDSNLEILPFFYSLKKGGIMPTSANHGRKNGFQGLSILSMIFQWSEQIGLPGFNTNP